jgi:hypothetical protein
VVIYCLSRLRAHTACTNIDPKLKGPAAGKKTRRAIKKGPPVSHSPFSWSDQQILFPALMYQIYWTFFTLGSVNKSL